MEILEPLGLLDSTVKLINLVLATALFAFSVIGIIYMRNREVFKLSGRYALWGIFYLTLGGLVGAIGNMMPGDQPVLTLAALAVRVTAAVYLATHIIFNIRKERDLV